jgi:hypothetical protein
MSVAFTYYAAIKNNLCLAYFGLLPEYVVLLKIIRPYIESKFPELKLFICCNDELYYLLHQEENILKHSEIKNQKNKFAYIREIKTTMHGHAIYELLKESNLNFNVSICPKKENNRICYICPDGGLPTNSLHDVSKYRALAMMKGYHVQVLGSDLHRGSCKVDKCPVGQHKLELINSADWIIGVENEYLYEAASRGIKTSLCPSGVGTNLYKLLFPNNEIIL